MMYFVQVNTSNILLNSLNPTHPNSKKKPQNTEGPSFFQTN
jgi:hypothetical protein